MTCRRGRRGKLFLLNLRVDGVRRRNPLASVLQPLANPRRRTFGVCAPYSRPGSVSHLLEPHIIHTLRARHQRRFSCGGKQPSNSVARLELPKNAPRARPPPDDAPPAMFVLPRVHRPGHFLVARHHLRRRDIRTGRVPSSRTAVGNNNTRTGLVPDGPGSHFGERRRSRKRRIGESQRLGERRCWGRHYESKGVHGLLGFTKWRRAV